MLDYSTTLIIDVDIHEIDYDESSLKVYRVENCKNNLVMEVNGEAAETMYKQLIGA